MSETSPFLKRKQLLLSIKNKLLQKSMPRLQVSLIMLFTGLFGFLVSFLLLHLGLISMGLRYPLAILFAYIFFLLLLKLWIYIHSPRTANENSLLDNIDLDGFTVPDIPFFGSVNVSDTFQGGGGGSFGGGGASGSWGDSPFSLGDVSLDVDADEGGLVILLVVFVLLALLSAGFAVIYVIYIAPNLLSEIFLDGVLMSALYKRMKKVEQKYWLTEVIHKTALPATFVMIIFMICGFVIQHLLPKAVTLSDVLHKIWK